MGDISAGGSIWYGPNDNRNTCLKLQINISSNKLGELTINRILEDSKKWELTGYMRVPHKDTYIQEHNGLAERLGWGDAPS
jgi:hypothetical protein